MDGDRRSAQIEQLELVETGRRRRWSEDKKLKIVLESLRSPRLVAATARRYGMSRSLLLRWRRLFRPEPAQQVGFIAAWVVPESWAAPGPVGPAGSGTIEIDFAAGARMRITGTVDAVTLKAVVAALVRWTAAMIPVAYPNCDRATNETAEVAC